MTLIDKAGNGQALSKLSSVEFAGLKIGSAVVIDNILDEDDMASDSDTALATQQSIKAYVDNRVSSGVTYKGAYDAATNTPDLDVSPTGVKVGDMYTVTVAGTFFTIPVVVGDVLISEVDDATTETEWTILQKNLEQATTTVAGITRYATDTEVTDGTESEAAITPSALAAATPVLNLGDGTNAVTQAQADNSTNVATTEYVDTAIYGKMTYEEVTAATKAMEVNKIYAANRASLITFTLPITALVGDRIRVEGIGTGGWKIAQNSGQSIFIGQIDGVVATTTWVSGYAASQRLNDSIEIICTVANTTFKIMDVSNIIDLA